MASGWVTTSSLSDSLDDVRSAARIVREQVGNVSKLCDQVTLGEGIGTSWQELSYAQITAQAVTENTELDNPQQFSDSLLSITPNVVGIETFITDRVKARINKKGLAQIGVLGQNAMERKKDEDCLTLFASGASTCEPGAGGALTAGHIAAAAKNISSDATEPGPDPIRCVLHGFQIKDLFDELVAGVGTYVVSEGPTADVFKKGFTLPIAGCEVYEDGHIAIDGNDDARGAVFSKMAIVKVQGRAPRMVTVRNEKRGGGGEHVYHYDEYAYGERSSGNWLYSMMSDAAQPTS
mgnify:CR=1 FL=1